jgi:hypothetical protein
MLHSVLLWHDSQIFENSEKTYRQTRNVLAYCWQLSATKKTSFARFVFDRKKTNYLKTEFQVKKEKTQDKAKIF